jgi:hypothetical protein
MKEESDKSSSEKEQVLSKLQELIENGEVDRADVYRSMRRVDSPDKPSDEESDDQRSRLAQFARPVLVLFTTVLVCVLLGGYIWWEWNTLSRLARVGMTVGTGIILLTLGILFDFTFDLGDLSSGFYGLSGIALPVGVVTWYHLYGFDVTHPFVVTQVTGLLFLLYLGLYLAGFRTVLLELSILYGTGLFVGVTDFISSMAPVTLDSTFYYYRALILGIIWMVVGWYSHNNNRDRLAGFLFALGSFSFLGSAFLLGGDIRTVNPYWEAMIPIIALVVYFTGVIVKSRFCIFNASIFLILYMARISNSFFRLEMGLLSAVVIFGFGVISIVSLTMLLYGWVFPHQASRQVQQGRAGRERGTRE